VKPIRSLLIVVPLLAVCLVVPARAENVVRWATEPLEVAAAVALPPI
jgi:hypothetical protein